MSITSGMDTGLGYAYPTTDVPNLEPPEPVATEFVDRPDPLDRSVWVITPGAATPTTATPTVDPAKGRPTLGA